jgi:hypothetical protein
MAVQGSKGVIVRHHSPLLTDKRTYFEPRPLNANLISLDAADALVSGVKPVFAHHQTISQSDTSTLAQKNGPVATEMGRSYSQQRRANQAWSRNANNRPTSLP